MSDGPFLPTHVLLIELLAIKQYEHDAQSGEWPPKPGWSVTAWRKTDPEDRQTYRDMIANARTIEDLYA